MRTEHRSRSGSNLVPSLALALSALLVLSGCHLVDQLRSEEESPAAPVQNQPSYSGSSEDDQGEAAAAGNPAGADRAGTDESGADPGDEEEAAGGGAADPDVFVAQLELPDRPPEMARTDADGAASAAEYFLYTYTYAYGTGDTQPLLAMSGPDCGFCLSVAGGVDEAHAGEAYMRTGDPEISSIASVASEGTEIDFLVQIEAQMPQMLVFDAADEITAEVPAQGVVANLGLVHEGGEWLVVGAGLE